MNNCTGIFVITIGVIIGLTGVMHGLEEFLQGNKPTEGVLLAGIGAISLIPNYLFTGIAAMLSGLSMIIWTITSIRGKRGPAVFLAISILMFLCGGGIAMLVPAIVTWGLATRLDKPLNWWRKMLPEKPRKLLAGLWRFSFIGCFISMLTAILIWIILTPPGPGYKNPAYVHSCWSFLALALVFLAMTIITGLARDIIAADAPGSI